MDLEYIDSEQIEQQGPEALLANVDAVLVPGGFGDRGTEGKIAAIGYARENKMPFFGICLGMQLAVVEYARARRRASRARTRASSTRTRPHAVIDLMPEQRGVTKKGATMRLGAYPCVLVPGTLAAEAYGATEISERHRHRYEFSNDYRDKLVGGGPGAERHVAGQAAGRDGGAAGPPVLRRAASSTPSSRAARSSPHPLFARFVRAALERQAVRGKSEQRKTSESHPGIN